MDKRKLTQALTAILQNGNLRGFLEGRIYKGELKSTCVPGLNCYSCPGALGSCPLGALQNMLSNAKMMITYYVIGFLALMGALFGRLICGWVCPFGLIQELLHRIPSPKLRHKKIFGVLKYGKYVMLAVLVIGVPVYLAARNGYGIPSFCQFVCPAGTLEAGIPLVSLNEPLRQSIGALFYWKLSLMIVILAVCVPIYRPFCRFICPLGAIYAFFNRIAVFGIELDTTRCTDCGACLRACKMEVRHKVRDAECIGCGDCIHACPHNALSRRRLPLMGKEQKHVKAISGQGPHCKHHE